MFPHPPHPAVAPGVTPDVPDPFASFSDSEDGHGGRGLELLHVPSCGLCTLCKGESFLEGQSRLREKLLLHSSIVHPAYQPVAEHILQGILEVAELSDGSQLGHISCYSLSRFSLPVVEAKSRMALGCNTGLSALLKRLF